MKIGLVTINDTNSNYGNKLQNYASIEVLKRLNASVETIITEPQRSLAELYVKKILNILSGYKLAKSHVVIEKKIKFRIFDKKYLNFNNRYIKHKNISNDFNYFAVGSDQVWNPSWYNDLKKEAFLLTFVRDEQKICVSPSFGVSELPKEWKPFFEENLQTFPMISVREEAGAKIIKNLTGKDAQVLIDPTLMLDKKEWLKIAKPPKKNDFENPYILTYFLGEKTKRINCDIDRYAKENRLQVYNLMDRDQSNLFVSGPSEFIYLISHASLIMTDSFHACVFAFLFQKPFLVYARNGSEGNMMSRIDTLLNTFDLRRKYADSGLDNKLFECNYSTGYKQLEAERAKAETFLRKSLHLE